MELNTLQKMAAKLSSIEKYPLNCCIQIVSLPTIVEVDSLINGLEPLTRYM